MIINLIVICIFRKEYIPFFKACKCTKKINLSVLFPVNSQLVCFESYNTEFIATCPFKKYFTLLLETFPYFQNRFN